MFLSGTATRNLQPHKIYCQNYIIYISNVENDIVYKMSNGVTY